MEWNRLVSPFMEMMVVINSGNGGTILQASHTFRKVTGYGGGFLPQEEDEDEEEEEENEQRVVRSSIDPKNRALRRRLLSHAGEDEVPLRAYIVREDWPKMKRVLGVGQPVKAKEGKEANNDREEEEDRSRANENENLAGRRAETDQPCERHHEHHRPPHHHQLAQQLLGGDLYSAPPEADIERVAGAQQQQDADHEALVTQTTSSSTTTSSSSSSTTSTFSSALTSSREKMMMERDGGGWSRVQCRLVTEGGSQLWIAWTAKRRGHLVFLSGTLVPPQGGGPGGIRRHSLAEQDGQRLARTYLASAASHHHHHHDMILAGSASLVSSPPDESRRTAVVAVTDDDDAAALVEQQAQIQTKLLLEEQAALVDVLAELFPGVMIARLSVPSLEYTFANAAFCLRFGELKRRDAAASNKVIGRTLAQVRGRDAASALRPHIETCLQGRQLSFQTRVPAPPPLPPYMFNADTDQEEEMQATLIPDVEASTGRVRGLFEVIQTSSKSERRLTAEELEYQAHITQTITQNAASCLFMMDHKGFPTFMNLAAERVTGYTLDEIKDKPLHYAVHWKRPDNTFYPMEECPIDNSTAELVAAQEVEEVFVRKDGTIFPVICAVAPLSKSGRTVGAVIEFRDVTEERRRENERLSALRDAEEHQRKRAAEAEAFRVKQERFIDTICHEIRNPINGIYGNVTLLQDELASVHAQLKGVEWPAKPQMTESLRQMEICVNAISTCAKHQKVITDDVLHLSKLEANKIELNRVIYNPMEVIKSAASMFMSQIQEKKLTLHVNDPTPLPSSLPDEKPVLVVRGDPDRFMQVVVNLLSNGIKFTHRGGITVSTHYLHREDRDTTELRVEVADTGIGMSHEEQSRIFDRFSQASHKTYREYGGSGLGLSIAKGLVALMGGVLDVRSRKGAGSTFHFTMECGYVTSSQLEEHNRAKEKLKETQARQSQELTLSANSKPVTPKRILVAEDNSINKRVILRFLERRGHYCEAADNGEEALSIYLDAVAKGRRFDLIFMDIEMPVMDGLTATQLIRERERMLDLPATPVIGLSGNSRQQQITRALKGGMSDYITKPYEQHTIYSKLALWTTDTPPGSPHAETRAASPGRPDGDGADTTATTQGNEGNEEGKEKEKARKSEDGKQVEEEEEDGDDGEEGEKDGDGGRRRRRQRQRRRSVVDDDDDEEEREPPPPSSPPSSEEDSVSEVDEER